MLKKVTSLVKFLVVVACATALVTAEPPNLNVGTVTLATGPAAETYFAVGGALAKAAEANEESSGIRILVEATEGAVDNVQRVAAGRNEFGIAPADIVAQALQGLGPWEEYGPQSSLRSVLTLYLESVALVVRADSDIQTLDDLRGKIVNIGGPGSRSRIGAIAVMEGAGIDWKSEVTPYAFDLIDIPPLLQDGSVDAFFVSGGHPINQVDLAGKGEYDVRLIPIFADGLELPSELYFQSSEILVGDYENVVNRSDVETIGIPILLVSSEEIDPHVVKVAASAIVDNAGKLPKLNSIFTGMSKSTAEDGTVGAKHDGADRYFEEAE